MMPREAHRVCNILVRFKYVFNHVGLLEKAIYFRFEAKQNEIIKYSHFMCSCNNRTPIANTKSIFPTTLWLHIDYKGTTDDNGPERRQTQ